MRGCATVIAAAVAGSGCAADGEGLVIRFDDTATATQGRDVVQLELFIGRTGSNPRFARDYDPMRDLFAVDAAALDGYRLYLRADVVPTDLEVVAIVGYDGNPATGGVPVMFGVVLDPPFAAGELTEIPMVFEPVVVRGQAGTAERWIDRWGAAPIEPVADHACLQWGRGAQSPGDGQIVRVDDLDCDGTVPPTCDPMQQDRTLLEGDPDVDGDTYGEWATAACTACLVQDGDDEPLRPVRCDCDETDVGIHFGAAEICDGRDNNCDGLTNGDYIGPLAIPCQVSNGGGGDCSMGVHGCVESTGFVDDACVALPAPHVSCIDFSACRAPGQCPVGGANPAGLNVYHCTQPVSVSGQLCGVAALAQLFPSLGVAQPVTCSATLWNGNPPGWKVLLTDAAGNHARSFTDVACDTLSIVVEQAPPVAGAPHAFVVLVISDATGTPVAVAPIDIGLETADGICVNAITTCTPPP